MDNFAEGIITRAVAVKHSDGTVTFENFIIPRDEGAARGVLDKTENASAGWLRRDM